MALACSRTLIRSLRLCGDAQQIALPSDPMLATLASAIPVNLLIHSLKPHVKILNAGLGLRQEGLRHSATCGSLRSAEGEQP